MANETNESNTSDRRQIDTEGSSLSGSKKRDNDSTEKALHPDNQGQSDFVETVDQDPGERQKENQNQSKDDPLAA